MSLRINQNILSIKTHGVLASTSSRLEKSIEKLSSGLRINRAADDAAGLAISEKLRRQVRGLSRAILNAQDGISMIQTAEGAMGEGQSILQRMRELALQASNDTLTSNDRLEIQKEVNQLRDDLNRIANNTEFNTKKLLDGSQTALITSSSKAIDGLVVGLGNDGGDYEVSIALLSSGVSQMLRSQIFTINDDTSTLAKGTTQLQSIAQFYDSNGVFVLENPQVVTLNGNSKSTTFNIDGQMTLDRLGAAIQNALISTSGLAIEGSKVGLVNTSQTGIAAMGGYLEMFSGMIGEEGEIGISADQAVLNSIGLSTVRESKNNLVEVTIRDSFGNIRQVRTESDRASGLLEGIDIQFSSQTAQIAGVKGLEAGLTISASIATIKITLDGVTTVNIEFITGYWTMEGLARSFNAQVTAAGTAAIGLSAAVAEGELRISFEPPTGSTAISTFTIAQATGVESLGFANGSYGGFANGDKDSTKITWGFTRYYASTTTGVLAGSTAVFTIGDDNTAGSTIALTAFNTLGSASATVGDMIRFIDFQATGNEELTLGTVKVRVDQVGSTMAFTSLRCGCENRNGLDALTSVVSMVVDSSDTTIQSQLLNQFGLFEGTVKGSGDKNFRLHVILNNPQFQIGADPGQVMKIGMSNMNAKSLDVDKLDLTNTKGATIALGKINKALDSVSAERSKLGSFQNRLEYSISNLRNTHSNMVASESRIRDADIALEMIEFTRNQIVSQSGTAMLAQANLVPQGVLQLLR